MKKRILLIEDDREIRENIKLLLESQNFSVVLCSDGEEGIKKASVLNPDLIVCDIMLPGIDGYDVFKAISKDNGKKLIPFIFLTAKVERPNIRKGMELGADDYITKPFESVELLKAIKIRLQKYDTIYSIIENKATGTGRYTDKDVILIRVGRNIEKIVIDKIISITAENQYSMVHVAGRKKYTLKRSLAVWEKILSEMHFIRIHRSTLINIHYMKQIKKTANNQYVVHMFKSDEVFQVSRRYFKNIKKYIP